MPKLRGAKIAKVDHSKRQAKEEKIGDQRTQEEKRRFFGLTDILLALPIYRKHSPIS
jgi:hypothetical protein